MNLTFSNNIKLTDDLLQMNLVLKYQSSLNIHGKVLILPTFYRNEKKLTKYDVLVVRGSCLIPAAVASVLLPTCEP